MIAKWLKKKNNEKLLARKMFLFKLKLKKIIIIILLFKNYLKNSICILN